MNPIFNPHYALPPPMSNCRQKNCPHCSLADHVIKSGTYYRANDSRTIQRYKCLHCLKRFSASTSTLEFMQKKRRVNFPLFKLLSSGISQRRTAFILHIDRKTVARKLIYWGEKSRLKNKQLLQRLKSHPVKHLQFDDLITKENSKLKPLSVSVAVDAQKNLLLKTLVSQIPAFGHLAKYARSKYGHRICHHKRGLKNLFEHIAPIISPYALIRSDEHQHYPYFVAKHFPTCRYERYKSERSAVVGQGELKKIAHDPLFAVNHTCAMLRANINRLIRKTWCKTKDPKRLQDHCDMFTLFFNQYLVKKEILAPP